VSQPEGRITSDQYNRFILADVLIELETAHAYSRAASRLEESDPLDFNNLCARIYAHETALRSAYRLRRFALGTGGTQALESLEERAPLSGLELYGQKLLDDRRNLGAYLAENRLS
jgi:hypothetical protein